MFGAGTEAVAEACSTAPQKPQVDTLEGNAQRLLTLARTIVTNLVKADLMQFTDPKGTVVSGREEALVTVVADELRKYFEASAALQAEAEGLVEERLRGASRTRAGDFVGVDRHRMVQLIRDRLAKERNFPL
jgi:hypothetical protein